MVIGEFDDRFDALKLMYASERDDNYVVVDYDDIKNKWKVVVWMY